MPRRVDLVVGAVAAVLGGVSMGVSGGAPLGVAGATVLGASLALLRTHPRTAGLVATAAVLLTAPDGDVPPPPMLYPAALGFGVARWGGKWTALVVLGLIGAQEVGAAFAHDSDVPAILITGVGWGAGLALRERETVAAQLAARVRELDEEREAYAALSVRYERARIASELHDIVAHAISVMVVQASAGQRLVAHDPELTAETFDAIADAARQAEDDMGRLVALLGDESTGAAPDLTLLEELVARAAGSGLSVTLRLEGDREGLPAALTEAAYRVVQEGLTNALRYAAGADVRVLVQGDHSNLLVEVTNGPADRAPELAGTGTGNGLRGLRERVTACGGTLVAAPTDAGGWRLAARLPRRVPSAA